MKLVSIQCPQCKAPLDIEENRKECFCTYCGNKILFDDGSHTVTHVYIDKAREKELELEEKKFNAEKEKNVVQEKNRKISLVSICVAVLFALITFVVIKNDFDITFNFSLMLIGSFIAIARIFRKESVFGIILSAVILFVACMIFIIARNDFDTTFTMTLVVVIVFHIVASFIKKPRNE